MIVYLGTYTCIVKHNFAHFMCWYLTDKKTPVLSGEKTIQKATLWTKEDGMARKIQSFYRGYR